MPESWCTFELWLSMFWWDQFNSNIKEISANLVRAWVSGCIPTLTASSTSPPQRPVEVPAEIWKFCCGNSVRRVVKYILCSLFSKLRKCDPYMTFMQPTTREQCHKWATSRQRLPESGHYYFSIWYNRSDCILYAFVSIAKLETLEQDRNTARACSRERCAASQTLPRTLITSSQLPPSLRITGNSCVKIKGDFFIGPP